MSRYHEGRYSPRHSIRLNSITLGLQQSRLYICRFLSRTSFCHTKVKFLIETDREEQISIQPRRNTQSASNTPRSHPLENYNYCPEYQTGLRWKCQTREPQNIMFAGLATDFRPGTWDWNSWILPERLSRSIRHSLLGDMTEKQPTRDSNHRQKLTTRQLSAYWMALP